MSNIAPLDSTWKSKRNLAQEIGVHPRTINNMFNRGEVNRRELDGVVWFQLACNARDESTPCNSLNQDIRPELETFSDESSVQLAMQLRDILAQERVRASTLDERNQRLIEELLETKDELAKVKQELSLMKVERDFYSRQVKPQFNVLSWLKTLADRFLGRR